MIGDAMVTTPRSGYTEAVHSHDRPSPPRTSPESRRRSRQHHQTTTTPTNTKPKTIITLEAAMAAVAEAELRKARQRQRHEEVAEADQPRHQQPLHPTATDQYSESSISSPNPPFKKATSTARHPLFPVESPTQSSSTVPDAVAEAVHTLPLDTTTTTTPRTAKVPFGGPKEYKIEWRRMWESARPRSSANAKPPPSSPSSGGNDDVDTPVPLGRQVPAMPTYRYTKGPVRIKRKKVVRFMDGSSVMAQHHHHHHDDTPNDDIEVQRRDAVLNHDRTTAAAALTTDDIGIKEIRVKSYPERHRASSSSPNHKLHTGPTVESARMRWIGMTVLAVIAILVGASCGIAGCRAPSSSSSSPSPSSKTTNPTEMPERPTLIPIQTIRLSESTEVTDATSYSSYYNDSASSAARHRPTSIAIHGDTMVVGVVPSEEAATTLTLNTNATSSIVKRGAVYIYHRSTATSEWVIHSTLHPPPIRQTAIVVPCTFGSSVSIWNDIIVVGTTSSKANLVSPIFVYERESSVYQNTTWTLSAQLLKDVQSGGGNHRTTSIHETTIVVGSYAQNKTNDNDSSNNETESSEANLVYIFERDAPTGAWTETVLATPSASKGTVFGTSVAAFGTFVVVGAPSVNGDSRGLVHVYTRVETSYHPTSWIEMAVLAASSDDSVGGELFGSSVAIYDTTLVIGAPNSIQSGSAFVYSYKRINPPTPTRERDSHNDTSLSEYGVWTEEAKLSAYNDTFTDSSQSFGSHVQIWNDTVVVLATPVGSSNETVDGLVCACGYVFTRAFTDGEWTEGVKLVREGQADATSNDGGRSGPPIAMSVDTIIVLGYVVEDDATNSSDSADDEGMVFVYEGY